MYTEVPNETFFAYTDFQFHVHCKLELNYKVPLLHDEIIIRPKNLPVNKVT